MVEEPEWFTQMMARFAPEDIPTLDERPKRLAPMLGRFGGDDDPGLGRAIASIRSAAEESDPERPLEPMRFLRHRDVIAWKRRRSIEAAADLMRQEKVYLPRVPNAREYRGGPLVIPDNLENAAMVAKAASDRAWQAALELQTFPYSFSPRPSDA